MKKLLIATKNKGKLADVKHFLSEIPIELVSLSDIGITEDVEEDGLTYEVNSQKKALFYSQKSGLPSLADDAGLEITALGGAPGVHSRRWLGYSASDEELISHLYKLAKDFPDDNRQAFFKTVISLALPDGSVVSISSEIEGIIAKEPVAELVQGYPYRAFFYLPQLNKYYAMLTPEEQKLYNHRYRALQELKPVLLKLLSV